MDAWRLVDYYTRHYDRVCRLPGEHRVDEPDPRDPADPEVDRQLPADQTTFTGRDITRAYPSRDYEPWRLEDALGWIESRKIIRKVEEPARGPEQGRSATVDQMGDQPPVPAGHPMKKP